MRSLTILIFLLLFCPGQAQEVVDSLEAFVEGVEDTTTIKILRLRINSDKPDFSPYVHKDELYFVSGRNREIGIDYVDENGESEITDLYKCKMLKPEKFRNVNGLEGKINTRAYEGPFCISKDGNIIYFTANDKKTALLKIYKSERLDNRWNRPEMLTFCKDNYSYFHPALSLDETILVYSTDRNKEKNKVDLFSSSLENGEWTAPRALNTLINDTNSQVFPFISQNNTLYFSCDKKNGTGMDIYSVSMDSTEKLPRPLLFPVNSPYDDFGIWLDSTSASGYFSSNRIGKFKDDIYYFTNSMPDFRDSRIVVPKTQFCYSFVEESSIASQDTVNLTYEWDFGDGTKSRGLRTRHCFPAPGDYQVVLNVVDKMSGEIMVSETSYPLTVEKPSQLLIESAEEITVNETFVLNAKEPYIKNCKVEKVCWSFGDGRFNSGATVKHIYKKPGTYTVQLGVVAKNKTTDKKELYRVERSIQVKAPEEKKQ